MNDRCEINVNMLMRGKEWRLVRRHRDQLFSDGLAAKFKKLDRPADVYGGFFLEGSISVDYNYLGNLNTPKTTKDYRR